MKRSLFLLLATFVLFIACQDTFTTPATLPEGPPLSTPPIEPSFDISDAVHGTGGNPNFFFLPPMVPSPTNHPDFDPDGFDPSLFPMVEICESDPESGCLETQPDGFPLVSGSGELEAVKLSDDHYHVNWHTKRSDLDAARTYRIRVLVDGTELGFADVDVVNTGKDLKNLTTGEFIPLLDGTTLPIKCRIEEGALDGVGPDGGLFVSQNGKVVLDFPEGALAEVVWVSVEPTATFPTNITAAPGSLFDFGPEDIEFALPVTLTLTYDPARLPAGVEEHSLRLGHVVDGVWVMLEAQVNALDNIISGLIWGFSTYGVLAPTNPTLSANLAYTSNRDGDHEIYVTDGAVENKITDNSLDDRYPDWRGGRMLFVRDGDIYTVLAGGGAAMNLSNTMGVEELVPNWSPDGTSIAYLREAGGEADVWVMNVDGSNQRNVTNAPGYDAGPVWSPDGQKIAFHSDRDGDYEVYSMSADGSEQTNLTNNPGMDDWSPTWSPDGNSIAYARQYEGGGEGDLWIMDASGSNHENLTKSSFGLVTAPAWSPDGTQIAFTMWGRPPSSNYDVWVIAVDGSTAGPVIANPSAGAGSPAWRKPAPPLFEVCNGIDDDLDGEVDESLWYCIDGAPAPNTDGEGCHSGWEDWNGDPTDGCEVEEWTWRGFPTPDERPVQYYAVQSTGHGMIAVGQWGIVYKEFWGPPWDLGEWEFTDALNSNGLWANSPEEVFAVADRGYIWHYAPGPVGWTETILPGEPDLRDVWGYSPTDVYAVGAGVIYRYQEPVWNDMLVDGGWDLYGIWGNSPTDVFAVGKNWVGIESGFIVRYDGTTWEIQDNYFSPLYAVWGNSANDVFAVGEAGTILHYDGTTWTAQASDTGEDLYGVSGTSGNDVYAVGSNGTVLHYDGEAWSPVDTGLDPSPTGSFYDVWAEARVGVWVVGQGSGGLFLPLR